MIEDCSLRDWMNWAEERIRLTDPLASGARGVFDLVATTGEWSYRD